MAAGVTKPIRNEALYAKRTYVAERHRRADLAAQVSSIARPRHPLGAEIPHFLLICGGCCVCGSDATIATMQALFNFHVLMGWGLA
jgi:hypothetical protein